jgi:hypothetical protein
MGEKSFIVVTIRKGDLEGDAIPPGAIAWIICDVSAHTRPTDSILSMAPSRKKYRLTAFVKKTRRLSQISEVEGVGFAGLHATDPETEPLHVIP